MELFRAKRSPGFSLLELLCAVVIIGILAVLLFPAMEGIRSRMERVRCTGNLKSLHTAAGLYVQQYGHWPQINPALMKSDKKAYTKAWIDALQPMGIFAKGWICPTVQRMGGDPDVTQPELSRIDYIPMPFDDKAITPGRWTAAPWFVENADVHGNGNLVIFTDGSIRDLTDIRKAPPRSSR